MIARGTLTNIADRQNYVPVFINFSAQTSSQRTQEMIESKLERRRKNVIGMYAFFHIFHQMFQAKLKCTLLEYIFNILNLVIEFDSDKLKTRTFKLNILFIL